MPNRVINFKRDEWHTRDKLAELLDISVRTLYRRIDDGEIEVKDTPDGKRYRVAPEPQEEEVATSAGEVSDDKIDTGDDKKDTSVAGELIGLIREQLDQITDLRQSRGRLEAELESSQNDVDRAVGYVTQLEDELDRLDEERGQLTQDLQEERGRRLELEEQFDQLRAELNILVGARAKYHLERGRREQAEQKCDDLRDEMVTLHRELEKLTHQLDHEQQRRLKLALGSLSLEVRRGGEDRD
jgi:chromosome segregation ATPase